MSRKLPPLNALKAFEAAARHESFTRAASELGVTHAAVSRHIRDLERLMRISLFERTGRGVDLTEAGRTLAKDLSQAFDMIAGATARFTRSGRRRQTLVITSDVPFAAHWLLPRLGRFTAEHPDIELVIDPNPRPIDFNTNEADIGIRFGSGPWRGITSEKLFDAELTVVCSPSFLKSHQSRTPAELDPASLIQELDRSYWTLWLDAAGLAGKIVPKGPTLLADLTISAAEAGHGFALADLLIATNALVGGRLVMPFDISVPCHGYHLVHRKGEALSRNAQLFRQWLLEELNRSLSELGEMGSKGARSETSALRLQARSPGTPSVARRADVKMTGARNTGARKSRRAS